MDILSAFVGMTFLIPLDEKRRATASYLRKNKSRLWLYLESSGKSLLTVRLDKVGSGERVKDLLHALDRCAWRDGGDGDDSQRIATLLERGNWVCSHYPNGVWLNKECGEQRNLVRAALKLTPGTRIYFTYD